ncbi:hypothetical protein L6164_008888 [Bauhinia variegata]|uniref:Uncharacterized protein n=1 Tax=Bauhinia variegata TaxID=167791 RepID=A0ACB9PJJ8_BAUVA|nr:hypothetical protein L6164_008888 [Bauhinia variegata]
MASTFYTITFHQNIIGTTVTSSAFVVDLWISKVYRSHKRHLNKLIVGLDIEWRPNLEPNANNPVAIVQICMGHKCLIFQTLHADAIPASLVNFLGNKNFAFVGVGVQEDARKLMQDHKLLVGRTMDIAEGAALKYKKPELAWIGLKRLAFELTGKVMLKPKNVTLSHWDAQFLSYAQVEYATIDAYVSFLLGMQVFKNDISNPLTHYSTYPPQLTPCFWAPNRPCFPSDLAAAGCSMIPMLPSNLVTRYPNMLSTLFPVPSTDDGYPMPLLLQRGFWVVSV